MHSQSVINLFFLYKTDFKNHFKVYETTKEEKYMKFMKLEDVELARPEGYLLRFPLFIQGTSNAHVLFSPNENPLPTDNIYELVIGGFENSRIILRKRLDQAPLASVVYPNVLNVLKKKQFVFEVTVAGDIYLYSVDEPSRPLLIAYDPQPSKVNFFSFKNSNAVKVVFYYGYNPEQISNVIIPIEVKTTKKPISIIDITNPTKLPFNLLPTWVTKKPSTSVTTNIVEGDGVKTAITTTTTEIGGMSVIGTGEWGHLEIHETNIIPLEVVQTIGTKDPKLVKFEPVVMHPLMIETLPANVPLWGKLFCGLLFSSINSLSYFISL